jgi:hypothetical protein
MIKIFIKFRLVTLIFFIVILTLLWIYSTTSMDKDVHYKTDLVPVLNVNRVSDHPKSININAYKKHEKIKNKPASQLENQLEHQPEEIDQERQAKEIQTYISEFSSELLLAADLQTKFETDAIDPQLANETEKILAYVFYQGMEWQDFSPQEISCKTTICRVKLSVSTEEKNIKLMELVSQEMKFNNINNFYAFPVSLPSEGLSYVYFINHSSLGVLPGNN